MSRKVIIPEKFFHILSETATDSVILMDCNLNLVFANRKFEDLFGYAATGLSGITLQTIFPGFAETISDQTIPLTSRKKDGTEFPAEVTFIGASTQNEEATITCIIKVLSPINTSGNLASHEAEKALSSFSRIEQLKYFADTIPLILWTARPDGKINYINLPGQEYLGISFEEGQSWDQKKALHPEDIQKCADMWEESLAKGKPNKLECRLKRASDQAYRWNICRTVTIKDELGNIVKWIGNCLDIHDQKILEETLQETNEEMTEFKELAIEEMQKKTQMINGILANLPVIIYRINEEGIVHDLIGSGLKKLGKRSLSLPGNDSRSSTPTLEEIFNVKTGKADKASYITHGVNEDNQPWFFENYVFPDNVHNKGYIGFSIDITEKKMVEEQLMENRNLVQKIADASPCLLYVYDLIHCKNIYINNNVKERLGYTPEEISQMDNNWVQQILHPDDISHVLDLHDRVRQSKDGEVLIDECRLKASNGEWRWFRMYDTVFKRDEAGRAIQSIGSAQEITDYKKAEEALEVARAKAESANLSKTRFLANMSHEIRTPLNAILGFADILRKDDIKSEEKEEYLNYISTSGNLLLKLIGDILDLSKIEEGKLTLNNEVFNFKETIKSTVYPYKYKANEKGLTFSLAFDDFIPEFVVGDSNRIRQVIVNLIGNALKFTKQGGISISIIDISPSESGKVVIKVSISDTGIGIPKDKQDKIFETFTQADNTVVREFGGSGLGLSIAKELVKLMSGEIGIISPSNPTTIGDKGSTFWFMLCLDKAVEKNKQTEKPKADKEHLKVKENFQILVAEDNFVNQKLCRVILKNLGSTPEFAFNGKEAIDMILKKEYDLILMDVQMPIMDGLEATRLLRNEYRISTPIIGVSANVFQEDIEICRKAGMNGHLGKPFNEKQMYDIISEWAGKRID